MSWYNSTRRDRLPKDWPKRVAAIKQRDQGKCQAKTHHPHCNGKGTQVDHITPGDNHTLPNLQLLSTPCHQQKTTQENATRNTLNATLRKRPPEPHPGKRKKQP